MTRPPRRARLALPLALSLAPGSALAFQLDLSPIGVPRSLRAPPPPPSLDGAIPGVSPEQAAQALERAAAAWSGVEGSWLAFRGAASGPRVSVKSVGEAWPHDPRFVAHTRVVDGAAPGAIAGATVELNTQHFRFCERDCAEGQVPLGPVLLHELGHAIGLGHSGVRGAVMAPGLGASPWRGAPAALTEDDRRGVLRLYGTSPHGAPPPASAAASAAASVAPPPAAARRSPWWRAAGAAALLLGLYSVLRLKNSKAT